MTDETEIPEDEKQTFEERLRQHEHEWRVHDREMRVWEAEMARSAQIFSTHLAAVVDFASLAVKSVILANSAAAGAVLAFLATMWGQPGAKAVASPALNSVTIFAGGTFLAILCAAFSYLAQFCYAKADLNSKEGKPSRAWGWPAIGLHVFAVLTAVAAIVSFGWGAVSGLEALAAANGGFGTAR